MSPDSNIYLAINEAIYDNEPAKIVFVLSLITDKEALKWKEQYIQSITQNNRITFLTYAAFMAKFQEAVRGCSFWPSSQTEYLRPTTPDTFCPCNTLYVDTLY